MHVSATAPLKWRSDRSSTSIAPACFDFLDQVSYITVINMSISTVAGFSVESYLSNRPYLHAYLDKCTRTRGESTLFDQLQIFGSYIAMGKCVVMLIL